MRALSPKVLRSIRAFLAETTVLPRVRQVERDGFLAAIDAALKPKRAAKPARERREAKAKAHREETRELREAIMERAGDVCECGCGRDGTPADPLEMDHFFSGVGRRREAQSLETCWALRNQCHRAKTLNLPSAAHWLGRFIDHCERFGYFDAEGVAKRRLTSLQAQGRAR